MTNNVLSIDTADNKKMSVCLTINGKRDCIEQPLDRRKAQVVLPLLEHLLKKKNLTVKDLTAIDINSGPGSFTGIRVGLAIANTIALLLQISINGKPVGEFVESRYV
jgi:tRNA threonylcarbamoyladenosine biosynthesis protein TsaB